MTAEWSKGLIATKKDRSVRRRGSAAWCGVVSPADLGEDGEVLNLAVSREEDGYVDDLCGLGVVAEE